MSMASAADAIAFVFQQAQLLPWRTLVRNVELPLELAGVAKGERRERALALIEQVGLADARDRYPSQLSGGMQMRASLARALVTNPARIAVDLDHASKVAQSSSSSCSTCVINGMPQHPAAQRN